MVSPPARRMALDPPGAPSSDPRRPGGRQAADEAIAEAAADWIVRLSADDPDDRDQAWHAFEAWKRADPAHAALAASMERFVGTVLSLHGGSGPAGAGGRSRGGAGPAPAAARAARAALVGQLGESHPTGDGGNVATGGEDRAGVAAPGRGPAAASAGSSAGSSVSASSGARVKARGKAEAGARAATQARKRGRTRARTRIGAGLAGLVLVAGLAFTLATSLGLGPGAGLGWGPDTVAAWLADHRTRVGEQRTEILADGSRLVLGGASAVDVQFGATRRDVTLLRGEVLVDVAGDPARPFAVDSPAGSVVALGTRFLVRREAEATEVTMLESRAAVLRAGARGPDLVLEPGQRIRLDASGSRRLADIDPVAIEQAFRRQRLVVQDQPLAAVLDRLGNERPGLLRHDLGNLAGTRVTAVLPLDDTDQALQLLNESFPLLRIRRFGTWLVLVDRRP